MDQGILEVVKKEMARVNTDILGVSELKWVGIGKFNSGDHYINTHSCEQESLRRNGVSLIVKKTIQNSGVGCSLKNDRMISLYPWQTIQYQSNPSLFPNH